MQLESLQKAGLAIFCFVTAIIGSLILALVIATPNAPTIAAAFPPWWASSQIFKAAAEAGQPLRLSRVPWIIIVNGDRANLATRLRSVGAIFLLDPGLLAGCRSETTG